MKIAIVGAGFSGLACAWHLLHTPKQLIQVTLFDQKGIGGGASGIAAGLMHPFVGAKATLNWRAREGCEETLTLLHAAEMALGQPVASYSGMLRPVLSEQHRAAFSRAVSSHADAEWWSAAKVKSFIPELCELDSLYISSAVTVDSQKYLNGLWKACERKGAKLEIAHITHNSQLHCFDKVIFAVGANWHRLQNTIPDIKIPSLSLLKGQILELSWPEGRLPLPYPVNTGAYLVMLPETRCFAGATFEREWLSEEPDLSTCEPYIRHHLSLFSPSFAALPIVECRAQVRAVTKDKLPFICQSHGNYWFLGGMGSKGLLYHALMAKELCAQLLAC